MVPNDDEAAGRTVVDGIVARVRAGRAWSQRLAAELAELPDTLERIREGAASFELVGRRLEASSSALEDMTSLYQSTIADTAKRSADAAEALRTQLDVLSAQASKENVSSSIADMQRTFESLAELNPLWPRTPKPKR